MERSLLIRAARFLVAGVVVAGASAWRPASGAEIFLYRGEPAANAGIVVGGWGGGTAEETTETQFEGERSLKVKVRDLYQGARLDLRNAVDLAQVLAGPNPYFSVSVRISPTARQVNIPGLQTTPGAMPGMDPTMGGAAPGMDPTMMGTGMDPTAGTGAVGGGNITIPRISKLRVVFIGPKGSLEAFSMGELKGDTGGWTTVGIPLIEVAKKLGTDSFPVQRIIIGADSPDTMYIGRMALVNDMTGITAQCSVSQTHAIRRNTPVTFTATGEGGITPIKFSWDFDASDGIQEEAVGSSVRHAFPKEGRYTVTLTAKPMDGAQKEPSQQTIEVEVVP
ncbi:MAG: PKD domain-containing protein [Armatimonadota bacterium]|nr:PKD domain-containing protein [Armatimonadota bacterium]